MAPIMDTIDDTLLTIEGTIPYPGNAYTIPVTVELYATVAGNTSSADVSNRVARIEKQIHEMMTQRGYFYLRRPTGNNLSSHRATTTASTMPVVVQSKQMDWQQQQRELDLMFDKQSKQQLSNLPNYPLPTHLMVDTIQLLDYQTTGIQWLIHQETNGTLPPFYKQIKEKGKTVWFCDITNCSQPTEPKSMRGGILADEMGLGT